MFRSTGERVVDACLNYKSAFDPAPRAASITSDNSSALSTFLDENSASGLLGFQCSEIKEYCVGKKGFS